MYMMQFSQHHPKGGVGEGAGMEPWAGNGFDQEIPNSMIVLIYSMMSRGHNMGLDR